MKRLLGQFSAVTALLSLFASNALGAGPREVLVSRGGGGCLDADGLARTIHRDTSLPVRVVASGSSAERSDQILLRTSGRDRDITVTISGAGLDLEQRVRAPSCETATDVVAAFAVSALAPAPAVVLPPSSPSPPLTSERVEKLIGDALARRGVQLEELKVRMSIDATAGRYTARIAMPEGRCPQLRTIDLGSDLRPETISSVVKVIFPQVAAELDKNKECLANDVVAKKAVLLKEDLSPLVRQLDWRRRAAPVMIPIEAVGAGLWFSLGLHSSHDSMWYWSGAGMTAWAGAGVSDLFGGAYGPVASEALTLAGAGLLTISFGVGREDARMSPYALGAMSSALFVESAFTVTGALVQRPPSAATLAADLHRVASAEQRDQLTEEEFARIESDFRRSSSPLPRWLLAGPWLAGGAVALGAAFADTHPSTLERVFGGLGGGCMVVAGLVAAFPEAGYWHYQRALAQHGLQASWVTFPEAAGGGIVVRGRF